MASPVQDFLGWLTGIQTWKRALIAITLGVTALVCLLVYQHPDRIFDMLDAMMREQARAHALHSQIYMTPLYSDVQREVNRLEQAFGPMLICVMAWRVQLETNRQHVAAYAAAAEYRAAVDAIAAERWQVDLPFFGMNPTVNYLLGAVIAGHYACADATETWPGVLRFPSAELCVIGIPPQEGIVLSGVIGGLWREDLSDDDRDRSEAAFRAAAQALVWHAAR